MKSSSLLKPAIALVVFITICTLAYSSSPESQSGSNIGQWYSIVPPLVAIVLAFLTGRVIISLVLAVLTAGFLSQAPHLLNSPSAFFKAFVTAGCYPIEALKDVSHLHILAFIPIIFATIELIIASGAFVAIIEWLLKWVKTKRSAQTMTAFMGLIHFIDDYSNAIVVGSAMRPITDKFKISREKLAFLVDATSAPVAGLAVISTWISYEVGLFGSTGSELGINKDGYAMFFDALPYRFYCILMLAFVFIHALLDVDFGPMKKAQLNPSDIQTDEPGPELSQENNLNSASVSKQNILSRALCAIIPLSGLIAFHITGLWFSGHYYAESDNFGSPLSLSYWHKTIGSARNTALILACAGLFGLSLTVICNRLLAGMKFKNMLKPVLKGMKKCALPATILILAWSLKNCCQSLGTNTFLAELLADKLSPLWFPAIVFLVSSITSFATGTSWGTMAILIPTAIPIAFQLDGGTYGLTTMICLGAILDGAIFGDHCSPISDTTIISSISSGCNHVRHVRTQLPYSIFVAVIALICGYLPAARNLPWIPSITAALILMITALLCIKAFQKRTLKSDAEH